MLESAFSVLVLAEGISFYENGFRFYDPELGGYDQSEPILRSPYSHIAYAHLGHSLPTYAYAANNPLHFVDPIGLWTFNLGFTEVGRFFVGGEFSAQLSFVSAFVFIGVFEPCR